MQVATRMMLLLVGMVLLVTGGYMVISHLQRQDLLRDEMIRDTEQLGRALQAGVNHALRAGNAEGIEEMLEAAVTDEEIFASVLLDPAGEVIAGRADDLACLRRHFPQAVLASGEGRGWAECNPAVYWVALPLAPPAGSLVIAQRGALLERSSAAAVQRQLLLMLALLLTIAVMLPLILRGVLMVPLAEIMRGVRTLGETGEMPPIQVRKSAGELAELGTALNQVAEQLVEKRRELTDQAEETLTLQRRLGEAEKFAMIGRLSGGMAHELGSPLSVIAIRAEAIQLTPDVPPAAREHAEIIYAQVRRLTDFIQGLLHMAREQGIVFNPLDLVELLGEVREEITQQARAEEVQLELELPDEPVMVRGDRTLLRHAVRNLVRNSFHALHDHVGERRVHVHIEQSEHEVRLLVEDTGPGIPPAQLEKVFQPFYTTKSAGHGMGLGIPITRGIVEQHGGELFLENLKHSGLRAVIALPAAPPDSVPDA